MKIDGEHKEAKINKAVKQGCRLSPIHFILYIEDAIDEESYMTLGSNGGSGGLVHYENQKREE